MLATEYTALICLMYLNSGNTPTFVHNAMEDELEIGCHAFEHFIM